MSTTIAALAPIPALAGRMVFRTSGGNIYAVLYNSSTGLLSVYKSINSGTSFTLQDTAHAPTGAGFGSWAAAIDSTGVIHIIYVDSASATITRYNTFSTSTDLWGTQATAMTITGQTSNSGMAIAIDANDIPHIVIAGTISAAFTLRYANRIGGSWNPTVTIDTTNYTYVDILVDNNAIPIVIGNTLGSLKAFNGNTLNAASFTSNAVTSISANTFITLLQDSNNNSWIAHINSAGNVALIKHNSGDPWGTWQTAVTNSNPGFRPTAAAVGNTIHVLYQSGSTGSNLLRDSYDGVGATWGGQNTIATSSTFKGMKSRYHNRNNPTPENIDFVYDDGTNIIWDVYAAPAPNYTLSTDYFNTSFTGSAAQFTRTHTTDSLKRKQTTVSHTTDVNKKKTLTVSHTTSANKKLSGITRTHTTDSLLRRQVTKTHTTDANKRLTTTKTHITDANKLKTGLTKFHTTDANKKVSGLTRSHTTDSLKRKQFTKIHTTDANKKKTLTISHTTSTNKLKAGLTRTHTTDASRRKPGVVKLTDNFNDNSTNTALWNGNFNGSGNVTQETGGRLQIQLGGTSGSYSAYLRTNTFDLTGSSVYVQAPTVFSDTLTSTQMYIKLEIDATNFLIIGKYGGNLYAQKQVAGVDTVLNSIAYSTTNHAWWRISEYSGTLYFETSTDGATWLTRYSFANPFAVTALKVSLGAGTFAAQSSSTVEFDNFNTSGLRFFDNFDDNSSDPNKWITFGVPVEQNQRIELPSFTTTGYQGYDSIPPINLVSDSVTVEVVDAGNQSIVSWEVYPLQVLKVDTPTTHAIWWYISGGNIKAYKKVASTQTQLFTATYVNATYRWLRIRESAGTVYWDSSTDGVTWTNRATEFVSNLWDVSSITLEPTAGNWQVEGSTTVAYLDNVNVVKPTKTHSTDSYLRVASAPQFTRTHTTDSLKRIQATKTHTTDSLKRKQFTKFHTTDSNKKLSGILRTHTTDANKRKSITISHTTDANKKKANLTVSHTTSANKRVTGLTRSHTTDANKRVANITRTHTTDSLLRKQFTKTHTTDSVLRRQITKVHTTDANKRLTTSRFHTTDSNKKLTTTKFHTTSSNKRVTGITRTHTTDSLLRKQFTKAHTTDANKRITGLTRSHTTDANKRVTGITRSHTTDSFKRIQTTKSHTTDANKRKALTVSHTTDSNKLKSGITRFHTTDANKKLTGITRSHTTDSLKRGQYTKTHTTDANKKKSGLTRTHTTDALKTWALLETLTDNFNDNSMDSSIWQQFNAGGLPFSSSAEQNQRFELAMGASATGVLDGAGFSTVKNYSLVSSYLKAQIVSATGGANRIATMYVLVNGGTSPRWAYSNGNILAQTTPNGGTSPTTYATIAYSATTHAYWRIREASGVFYWDTSPDGVNWTNQYNGTPTGFVSPVKVSAGFELDATGSGGSATFYVDNVNIAIGTFTRTHTTDSLLRRQIVKTHTTDALKRGQYTRSHTTDSNKRVTGLTRSHTTDSLKRKQFTISHTTDANKRKTLTKFHTTDANKKLAGITRSHTTDSLLRRQLTKTHTTDSLLRKQFTKAHTTDSLKRGQYTRSHTTDANKKVSGLTRSHTTDSFLRRQITRTHTTDANKRKTLSVSHTTDANKRLTTTKFHTTSANKRVSGITRSHTTDSLKRKQLTLSHTTDANKKVAGLLRTHTTDALKRKTVTKTHTTDSYLSLTATIGPNNPGTATDSGSGFDAWTNTGNVFTSNDAYASSGMGFNASWSNFLKVSNFGFNIPAGATINGIKVEIEKHANSSSVQDKSIQLMKSLTAGGTDKADTVTAWPTTDAYFTYGSTSDVWGQTWTVNEINNSGFGVSIQAKETGGFNTAFIDHVRISVTYTPGIPKVQHTTDALKRKQVTVSHTTSANKRVTGLTLSHTTDTFKVVSIASGPRNPGTTSGNDAGVGTVDWATPGNIVSSDNTYATTGPNPFDTVSHYLKGTNFGFALPSTATVRGIVVEIERHASGNGVNYITDNAVKIVKSDGTIGTTNKADTVTKWPTADAYVSYGSSTDLWGVSWTYADINDVDFGAALAVNLNYDTNVTAFVDHMRITVYYTTPTPTFTTSHTTDAVLRKQIVKTHTTDSNKRLTTTKSHTTDANKKRTYTVSHTTDANKRVTGLTRTHTTDALKRKQFTKVHTTDANKRVTGITRTHTTDSLLRRQLTRTHTTDANKRKALTVSHTTDANKKLSGLTRSHTTDALKRGQYTRTHTTDSLLRRQIVKTHTTDALVRRQVAKTHTTDANKRKALTVSHTTDANRKLTNLVRTHTTDALKRKTFTVSHSTDSFLRRQITKIHTTDALKRGQYTRSHTTDSNKRKALTQFHTTDANKKLTGITRSHTTDANKRKSGLLRTHTTDSLLRRQLVKTHTTDSLKRKQFTVSHTTDALKRGQYVRSHTTDANKRRAYTVAHTTDANKRKTGLTLSHTTNSFLRRQLTLSHSTDSLLRRQIIKTHSTDSFLRAASRQTHTTDANKRRAYTASHTTDANKKKTGITVFHTTDANKRVSGIIRSHTTDALKRTQNVKTHTTNSLLRRQLVRTHTTDALKRKIFTLSHTTDSNKRKALTVSHTTDSNKRKTLSVSHTTDANKRITGLTKFHTTDSLLRRQITKTHTTDSLKRTQNTRTHTTDALIRKQFVKTHTTDSNKRRAYTVAHTTDANKKLSGITRTHTTDTLLRRQLVRTHTTDANKRRAYTVTHTTDSNKRRTYSVAHTTDANKKVSGLFRTHTTDANKRKALTVSHTTSANKRVAGITRSHTTDALLRRQIVKTHTTDANKRKTTTSSHTTDALKRKTNVVSHTTDAFKRIRTVVSHATDSNKRRTYTVSHTTDTYARGRNERIHSTDANKRRAYTISHTTSANKRKALTVLHTTDTLVRKTFSVSHTTDTLLHGVSFYTREQNPVLPTNAAPRSIGFSTADYGTVAADDSTYVDQFGAKYLLFYFERYAIHNRNQIYVTWNGKSTTDTMTRPVYLQLYNVASGLWETLDMNNTTSAGNDFTLSGQQLTNLDQYYDSNIKLVVRVYQ